MNFFKAKGKCIDTKVFKTSGYIYIAYASTDIFGQHQDKDSSDQEIHETLSVYLGLWHGCTLRCTWFSLPSDGFTRVETRCKLTSMKHQQMGDEDPCVIHGKSI